MAKSARKRRWRAERRDLESRLQAARHTVALQATVIYLARSRIVAMASCADLPDAAPEELAMDIAWRALG